MIAQLLSRRRLVFNLAPLLDLLIIVIFAQYLELRGRSERVVGAAVQTAVQTAAQAAEEVVASERELRSQAEDAKEDAVRVRSERERELAAKATTIATLREEVDQLRTQLAEALEAAEIQAQSARRDRKAALRVLQDVLNLPAEAFEPSLEDLTPSEQQTIRRQLEDVRGQAPERIVRHLRTFNELKRYVDFWEIYIREDGFIVVQVDGETHGSFSIRSADDFVSKMEKLSQQEFPEPKGLVVMLLSHGDSERKVRQEVENGLLRLAQVLRARYDNRKRFETAVLGYTTIQP